MRAQHDHPVHALCHFSLNARAARYARTALVLVLPLFKVLKYRTPLSVPPRCQICQRGFMAYDDARGGGHAETG